MRCVVQFVYGRNKLFKDHIIVRFLLSAIRWTEMKWDSKPCRKVTSLDVCFAWEKRTPHRKNVRQKAFFLKVVNKMLYWHGWWGEDEDCRYRKSPIPVFTLVGSDNIMFCQIRRSDCRLDPLRPYVSLQDKGSKKLSNVAMELTINGHVVGVVMLGQKIQTILIC